jgi:phosphoribosylamine--glycine ligase
LAAPGSDGIAGDARCFPAIAANDLDAVVELARAQAVDLVVVGPEDPLAGGLADRLRKIGIRVFGPSAKAAQLEASKSFAKDFMLRHGIPTARYRTFDQLADAQAYVREQAGPCVVKADGLAAGKGVAVCDGADDALLALAEMMGTRRFGDAGDRVVVEERLLGEEASYYAITDGERIVTLAAAQDHKRALDGDQGENTGGMGAYSPAALFSEAVEKRVREEIVVPTIRGMATDGMPYTGVLYVGLMIDAEGTPRVIEYNVRFGDPETQPLVVRMDADLVPLLDGAARGDLDEANTMEWSDASVCVVLASGGYPRDYKTGLAIEGLEEAASLEGVQLFHAGTRKRDGRFETAGGRVLGVTACGNDVAQARERAYAAAARIHFPGVHSRTDIAARATPS